MKNFLFLLLVSLAVISCKEEQVFGDTSSVNLNFTAVYSGEPLVTNNLDFQYKYPDGREVAFNAFNFFISDVALLEEKGGDEAGLVEINFIDFGKNTTLEDALRPISITKNNVPSGKYKGLKIGIGVPADLNNSSFNQLGANHPLRKNAGEWRPDWDSFIFLKLRGSYDIDGDGIGTGQDAPIIHRTGINDVYRTVTIPKQFVLAPGQAFDLNVVIDLLNLYQKGNEYLDLSMSENRVPSEPGNFDVANFIANNLGNAMTVE